MEHTYIINGMTCNHFRSSVEKALNAIEGIHATVTLDPPIAIISMDKHISTEVLQDALSKIGNYTIEMAQNAQNVSHNNHQDHTEMNSMHKGHDHSGHGHQNHDHAGGHMAHMGNLKQKFWISLIVAIPIILLSPMMGMKLPFSLSFEGSYWVVLFLASFLYFYGGWPFLTGAVSELKAKNPAMMTLISMGITVSYIYSVYAFVSNYIL